MPGFFGRKCVKHLVVYQREERRDPNKTLDPSKGKGGPPTGPLVFPTILTSGKLDGCIWKVRILSDIHPFFILLDCMGTYGRLWGPGWNIPKKQSFLMGNTGKEACGSRIQRRRKAQGLKTQKCSNLRVQYVFLPQNSIFEPSLLWKKKERSFEISFLSSTYFIHILACNRMKSFLTFLVPAFSMQCLTSTRAIFSWEILGKIPPNRGRFNDFFFGKLL